MATYKAVSRKGGDEQERLFCWPCPRGVAGEGLKLLKVNRSLLRRGTGIRYEIGDSNASLPKR